MVVPATLQAALPMSLKCPNLGETALSHRPSPPDMGRNFDEVYRILADRGAFAGRLSAPATEMEVPLGLFLAPEGLSSRSQRLLASGGLGRVR